MNRRIEIRDFSVWDYVVNPTSEQSIAIAEADARTEWVVNNTNRRHNDLARSLRQLKTDIKSLTNTVPQQKDFLTEKTSQLESALLEGFQKWKEFYDTFSAFSSSVNSVYISTDIVAFKEFCVLTTDLRSLQLTTRVLHQRLETYFELLQEFSEYLENNQTNKNIEYKNAKTYSSDSDMYLDSAGADDVIKANKILREIRITLEKWNLDFQNSWDTLDQVDIKELHKNLTRTRPLVERVDALIGAADEVESYLSRKSNPWYSYE